MALIRTFLFDLDGTLWDSEDAICKTLQHTIYEEQNISKEKKLIQKELIKYGSPMRVLKAYGISNINTYWRKYRENISDISLYFDNTSSIFDRLIRHRRYIGYVTSLKKEFAITLLNKFGIDAYAKILITPSECRVSKPHPRSILMAIEALSVIGDETIYIGDQMSDLDAAKRAGCKAGLASWSRITVNTKIPDYIFADLKEILSLL